MLKRRRGNSPPPRAVRRTWPVYDTGTSSQCSKKLWKCKRAQNHRRAQKRKRAQKRSVKSDCVDRLEWDPIPDGTMVSVHVSRSGWYDFCGIIPPFEDNTGDDGWHDGRVYNWRYHDDHGSLFDIEFIEPVTAGCQRRVKFGFTNIVPSRDTMDDIDFIKVVIQNERG